MATDPSSALHSADDIDGSTSTGAPAHPGRRYLQLKKNPGTRTTGNPTRKISASEQSDAEYASMEASTGGKRHRLLDTAEGVAWRREEEFAQLLHKVAALQDKIARMRATEPNDPGAALLMLELGTVYLDARRYPEAVSALSDAVAILREAPGADPVALHRGLNSLGRLLGGLGRTDEAKRVFQEVISRCRAAFPGGTLEEATAMGCIADCLDDDEELLERLALQENALAMKKRFLAAEKHLQFASLLNAMGNTHFQLGNLDKAFEAHNAALGMQRDLSADDSLIAITMSAMAAIECEQGEYEEALKGYNAALELQQECYGAAHPIIAQTLTHMGGIQTSMGNHMDARETYEQALAMRRSVLPSPHVGIAEALSNLAGTLYDLGEHEEAVRLLNEAIEMYKVTLPPGELSLAIPLNTLATILVATGQHDQAAAAFEEIVKLQRTKLGSHNPAVALTLLNLAMVYEQLKRHEDAFTAYEEADDILSAVLPEEHPQVMFAAAGMERCVVALAEDDKSDLEDD